MVKFLNFWLPVMIMLLLAIAFIVVSNKLTKGSDEKTKLRPIKIVWFVLLVFEFGKIAHMIATHKTDEVSTPLFDPLRYPLVFCSLILYTYPLFMFKKNKFSNSAMAVSVLPFFIAFIAVLLTTQNYELNFWHGHSIVFHFMMGAVAVYLLTSGLYKFKYKDYFGVFVWLAGYIVFSMSLSLFIGGEVSLFGPKSSYLGFLYRAFGYAPAILFLVFALYVLIYLIYGIIHIISQHINSLKENKQHA